MEKQQKPAKLKDKTEDSNKQAEEVQKPLSSSADGQAPTIPFEPYVNLEFHDPYSATLLEKANAIANKIWAGKKGYNSRFPGAPIFGEEKSKEMKEVEEKNKQYFDHSTFGRMVHRLAAISISGNLDDQFTNGLKISELIRKLRRLEKKYECDSILSEESRETIINTVLLPAHIYGVNTGFENLIPQFSYPPQKSVLNDLLTTDDVLVIEGVIAYIPKIRSLTSKFKTPARCEIDADALLSKKVIDFEKYVSLEEEQDLMLRFSSIANFFNTALPYGIRNDFVPAMNWPTGSGSYYEKLRTASNKLREASTGYIQENKKLSDLLESIYELSICYQSYFSAIMTEIQSCFNFITAAGIPFDKLVEESKERIKNSTIPF